MLAFLVVGLGIATFVEPQFASESASAWLELAERACYSLARIGLPVGLLVALSRYRLYDADTAISASVSYGAATVSLRMIFGTSEEIVNSLASTRFGPNLGAFAGGIGAAVAAVMIAPVRTRVSRWTERCFRGQLLHLRRPPSTSTPADEVAGGGKPLTG